MTIAEHGQQSGEKGTAVLGATLLDAAKQRIPNRSGPTCSSVAANIVMSHEPMPARQADPLSRTAQACAVHPTISIFRSTGAPS
ncbi:hypothetical protein FHS94_000933 [Sphingomonas aerophila]|uniref:Uncharacterized protein n=1 Tax=Sphingomonas aerophila TaxID=1344948 RepID=A0A7W9ETF7_9SPHN|nr:hypothetical protein [Sphingomonas aerophila]